MTGGILLIVMPLVAAGGTATEFVEGGGLVEWFPQPAQPSMAIPNAAVIKYLLFIVSFRSLCHRLTARRICKCLSRMYARTKDPSSRLKRACKECLVLVLCKNNAANIAFCPTA
jgi:hypothetical protein